MVRQRGLHGPLLIRGNTPPYAKDILDHKRNPPAWNVLSVLCIASRAGSKY